MHFILNRKQSLSQTQNQTKRKIKKEIIPGNNRVSCETPIVLDSVQIRMANPTEENFESDVIIAIFPAKSRERRVSEWDHILNKKK